MVKFSAVRGPVARCSISASRPSGTACSRIGAIGSTPSSRGQISGTFQSMGAPIDAGQPTLALWPPDSWTAPQSVSTRIASANQYQRPVCPSGSKGVL